jgi:hypothetical protein
MYSLCLIHCIHVCLLVISHLSDLIFEHGFLHGFLFHRLLHHGLIVVILLPTELIAASDSLQLELFRLPLDCVDLPLKLLFPLFLLLDQRFLLLQS